MATHGGMAMRRSPFGRVPILGALAAGLAIALAGADKPKKKEPPPPKADETIADVANIFGTDVKVEGVGLVMGLDGTGSDPAPSWQRTKLLDEMRKANIPHPENFLKSTSVTMVTVRATVPAGVTTSDRFDVEVELPTASSTTSLAGGWLVTTQLAQRAMTREGDKDDKVIAAAVGPVMFGSREKPDEPRLGRVLGGGRAKEDSPYLLAIKENRRSGKTSQLIENVITQRFHQVEGSERKGMGHAVTDAKIVLRVPKTYHHNQDRFHQIVKYLSLVDNPQLRQARLDQWGKDLLDPKKAGVAALKLEGLGPNANPTLKKALGSPEETVRFFAAEALAYLNENEGEVARVLAETARKKKEFRSFALKAMASNDQSATLLQLRALMNDPDPELRYGAFDALRTLDPTDPFLGKTQVLVEKVEPEDVDEMALQIAGKAKKKPRRRPDEPFSLYVVDSEGPPMVHVSRNMRCEVVLFGKGQGLLTPIVLGSGGPLLLNAADGDSQVQIVKITAKNLDAADSKVNSPLELAEVIRSMANLGSSYPEIVAVLASASVQKNLPGPLAIDAIPAPDHKYDEAQFADAASKVDEAIKKASAEEVKKKPSLLDRMGSRFKR